MHEPPLALKARGVGYTYPTGVRALEGVDLDLRWGERVALLGPNGAGKSTLLLRLSGLLSGEGTVDVHTPPDLDSHSIPLGIVFQDPDDQLLMPTVEDEVAFGLLNLGHSRSEVARRVKEVLAATGLAGLERRAPEHLSLGQRKRLCIAAILAMEPKVLLLDEADAGLDPAGKRDLLSVLSRLPCAILAATHDLQWAQAFCTDAVILARGQIVVRRSIDDLVADEMLLRRCGL